MALLCGLLLVASIFDYRTRKIPNLIPLGLLVTGFCLSYIHGGMEKLAIYFVTVIFVTAIFYPVFMIGGMGAGDVKLFGVSAGFFPTDRIIWFIFVALMIGAVIAVLRMIRWGDARERMGYCFRYFGDCLRTGRWTFYKQWNGESHTGICLAGPLFFSALLYIGGLY